MSFDGTLMYGTLDDSIQNAKMEVGVSRQRFIDVTLVHAVCVAQNPLLFKTAQGKTIIDDPLLSADAMNAIPNASMFKQKSPAVRN